MSNTDALNAKKNLLTQRETEINAAVSGTKGEIARLDAQLTQLENQLLRVAGAKLMLDELINEAPSPAIADIVPAAAPTT